MTTPSRFEILAYTGGKLRVEGFDMPVVVDLAGLTAEGSIPITIKHDTGDATILGQTDPDAIINDGACLMLGGAITAQPELSPSVARVIAMAANGHHWQASIGAQIEESRDIEAGQTINVNGQDLTGPFTLATQSVLRETAVLGMGADRKTSVTLSAQAILTLKAKPMADTTNPDATTPDDFATWSTSEDATESLQTAYAAYLRTTADAIDGNAAAMPEMPGEVATEPVVDPLAASSPEPTAAEPMTDPTKKKEAPNMAAMTVVDIKAEVNLDIKAARKQAADEVRRVGQVRALCKGDETLMAKAIEDGWDATRTELEYLKRQRSTAPAGHVVSANAADTLSALQGGMLLRAGVRLDNPVFASEMGIALGLPGWLRSGLNTDQRQKAMEAGWKYRDMSMTDLCKAASSLDGNRSQHLDGSNQGFIRAAVSGGSLANIFTTNMNALMIQKLQESGDSTMGWTREADAANFQTMDRIRLVKGGGLTKHKRAGTADSADRSDQIESYKIARYSQQFILDEQDIIDDHFQALKDMPDEMALACGRLRPDLVYSILLANGTLGATGVALFSASQPAGITGGAAQSNLATSAALSASTLQSAIAALMAFRENGVGVNQPATHLIVPPALRGTAYNLLESQNIAAGAGTTNAGELNPIASIQRDDGRIEVVTDHRLVNGVIDPNTGTAYSGSATTWRLASNKLPTIEVAYLRGSGRAPQVRQFILDRGQWGMGWDINLDIGAKALEWRGFYEARA
jgi:hypothetical protein